MARRVASIGLTAGICLVLSGTLVAQEPAADQMAAMMEAVAPDENHAVLEPLAGSWSHAVTFYPAPGAEPIGVGLDDGGAAGHPDSCPQGPVVRRDGA